MLSSIFYCRDQDAESQESDSEEAGKVKPEFKPRNSLVRKSCGYEEKTDKTDGPGSLKNYIEMSQHFLILQLAFDYNFFLGKKLMVKENMERGSISANTFHIYIKAAGGYFLVFLVFLVFLLNIGSVTFSSCWLAYWLKEGGGVSKIYF